MCGRLVYRTRSLPAQRRPRLATSPGARPIRLLIEANHVAGRISKPRGNLWRVGADRLDDFAAACDDGFHRCGHAVDHDVYEESGLGRRRPTGDPGATDLSDGIVEREVTVTAPANIPAENPTIELRRPPDVCGGNLEGADLTISKNPWHRRGNPLCRGGSGGPGAGRLGRQGPPEGEAPFPSTYP